MGYVSIMIGAIRMIIPPSRTKKKLTGLTVSLFNIFQKNYSSAGFIKL